MKFIKILRATVCDGESVKVGDIVEASPKAARFLVAIGKAEYTEKPKAKRGPKAKTAPVNRQVEDIETR